MTKRIEITGRVIEAHDKDGSVVAWSEIPEYFEINQWSDENLKNLYKAQIEREKGIEVTVEILV